MFCSRPSVSGSVRRAAGQRGKNEEGLGREARLPSLPLSHLDSLAFSLAAVFVRFRYHQLKAWNRLCFDSFSFKSLNKSMEASHGQK